ncbi:hypothetical protein C0J52_12913 [Blattella germanica]|nr:hypothetical protein C0J52_12913 [Blattella germanica]
MGCFKTQLKFSIVDNPFENLTAFLYGESFKEDITIDGVDITESETWTQKKGLQPKPPCYQLNYGLCYVNTLKKSCFKITNHSRAYTYRFQWAPHPNILFTPTVGHISPKSSKSIITSFFTSNPLEIKEVDLLCTIVKIKLKDKIPDVTAWDDRQTSVKWGNELILQKENPSEPVIKRAIGNIMKKKPPGPAPTVRMPESIDRVKRALIRSPRRSARQHACELQMNRETESIQEIILKNIGIVPLEFKWQLATSESYPVRPSSASLLEVAKVKELPYLSYVNVGTSDTMKNETAETSKSEEIKESSIDAYSQSQVLPSMCSVKSAISSSWAASAKYVSSIELLPHKRILGALPNVNYLYAPKRKKVGRRAYYKTKQASDVGQ